MGVTGYREEDRRFVYPPRFAFPLVLFLLSPKYTADTSTGINFHVREDAINDAKNMIDPAVLKPVSRLGGVSYSRTTTSFELLRPNYTAEVEKPDAKGLL